MPNNDGTPCDLPAKRALGSLMGELYTARRGNSASGEELPDESDSDNWSSINDKFESEQKLTLFCLINLSRWMSFRERLFKGGLKLADWLNLNVSLCFFFGRDLSN